MATQTLTSTPAFFGRLAWMIVGPFALAIFAISIAERHDGWLGLIDGIYFLVLGGMVLGRWLEFRYSQPRTATGEPATVADFRRYTWILGILGLGAWIAANLVGNQVIRTLG
jgi:hypothetical protein